MIDKPMLLLLDIGNTHTHVGLSSGRRLRPLGDIPTAAWSSGAASRRLRGLVGRSPVDAASLCSVVPHATARAREVVENSWGLRAFVLTWRTVRGVGINYPRPETIGPDRLANAVAARHLFGAPGVVVDFGTAVTFDVVDRRGDYIGGIIAPGLAAMTSYLHEKTALLPRVRIREVRRSIGRSTEEAMLVGAVHGYRGLVRALIRELKRELGARRLPVVATGGYAALIASELSEISAVRPQLTLEGLRLVWENQAHPAGASRPKSGGSRWPFYLRAGAGAGTLNGGVSSGK